MLYAIDTEERTAGNRSGTVYVLRGPNDSCRAEIWPSNGFNCLRWQVDGHDLLFATDDWEANPVPTRSGVPILFPFPNRIRDGIFKHGGAGYRLPLNDSTKTNAIHGFSPRESWPIHAGFANESEACINATFRVPNDVPPEAGTWPEAGDLSIGYRLSKNCLRIEAQVESRGQRPFPFGLGFHPYFRLPGDDANVSRYTLHAPARSVWPVTDGLPNGDKTPVPDPLDWNRPRMIGSTLLDTVYGDLGVLGEDGGLLLRATLGHADRPGRLEIWATADFRESVLFVPPHRQAVCIEPYTCVTDAINLQARGIDAGWRELPPGQSWQGVVEFRWNSSE